MTEPTVSDDRLTDPPLGYVTQQMWDDAQAKIEELRGERAHYQEANSQLADHGREMYAKLEAIQQMVMGGVKATDARCTCEKLGHVPACPLSTPRDIRHVD